jgi:hypothetical protein
VKGGCRPNASERKRQENGNLMVVTKPLLGIARWEGRAVWSGCPEAATNPSEEMPLRVYGFGEWVSIVC